MFNWFKNKEVAPTLPKIDWAELALQCKENILYITAYLNVLNSNIEYLRSGQSKSNRVKLGKLMETRAWLLRKLEEEKVDLLQFKQNMAPIFGCQTR